MFSPTLLQYIQNKCKSKSHFFCTPVLLLFYKLLLLLICCDILAIENYLQCREDDAGGQGEQKSLAGLLLAAFKYAQEVSGFEGQKVPFSVSKKVWIIQEVVPEGNLPDYMYGCTSSDKYKPHNFTSAAATRQMKSVAILTDPVGFFFDINW